MFWTCGLSRFTNKKIIQLTQKQRCSWSLVHPDKDDARSNITLHCVPVLERPVRAQLHLEMSWQIQTSSSVTEGCVCSMLPRNVRKMLLNMINEKACVLWYMWQVCEMLLGKKRVLQICTLCPWSSWGLHDPTNREMSPCRTSFRSELKY